MQFRQLLLTTLGVIVALILTILAYRPGLDGDFVFDDHANILSNTNIHVGSLAIDELWRASMEGFQGGFRRPLPMLSLALNTYAGGDRPAAFEFKLTNLCIHILTGVSLGFLAYLLLTALPDSRLPKNSRIGIAIFAASAWLMHPFNLTSVLYIVQRMTSLAALMMSIGMILYVYGRLQLKTQDKGWIPILIGTILFGILATLSKENGILLPLYLLAIEFCIFRFQAHSERSARFIKIFFVVSFLLPAIFASFFLSGRLDSIFSGYAIREFSLIERLMTEARIVIWYLRMLILPDNAQMGLFLDNFTISRSLIDPPTTVVSLASILGLVVFALRIPLFHPVLSLGILWFFAGHVMESTILPLELAFEHRNYLPGFGVLLAAMYYMLNPTFAESTLRIRWLSATTIILLFAINLNGRAQEWSNPLQHAMMEVEHSPISPRTNFQVGAYLANLAKKQPTPDKQDELAKLALAYFSRSLALRPTMASALIAQIIVAEEYNQPRDPDWLPRLLEMIPDVPFEATNLNALNGLTQCQIVKACHLPDRDYMSIIEAALQNKSLVGQDRASVYAYAGDYWGLVKGDYPKAIELSNKAAEIAPTSIQFRRERLKWLLAMDRDDEALRELDYIETLDTLRTMRPWIRKQREVINDALRQQQSG